MSYPSLLLPILPGTIGYDANGQPISGETKTHNIFEPQNTLDMSLFWLLLMYLTKHGQANAVQNLLGKMFDGAFKSLNSYSKAGAANRITAWGAGRLNSLVLERLGLISQIQAMDFASGISIISGFSVATDIGNIITRIFQPIELGSRDDGFPDSLDMGTETALNVTEKTKEALSGLTDIENP